MPLLLILIVTSLLSPVLVSSHTTLPHVVISEIQVGGVTANDEFVELLNPTDCPVSIDGWKLTKRTSGGTESNLSSSLSGTIPAHGFFLITPKEGYDGGISADIQYSQTSNFIAANNSVLLYADQSKTTLVDKVGFGTAVDFETAQTANPVNDGSIERVGGGDTDNNAADFASRAVSSPLHSGSPPISSPGTCSAPPPPPPGPPPPGPPGDVAGSSVVSIAQARQAGLDETLTTSGIVTVVPSQLSASYFYIQDDTGGLQIYSSKKSFPTLTVGQRVQVTGMTSEAYKERRLKTSDAAAIAITGSGAVQSTTTKTGSIGESYEGRLVRLSGSVTQTSGDTFYISDGSGEARIYIRGETGIDKPRMSKGDQVTIVGIVSQYNDTYRVLPREQSDLSVGEEESTDTSSGEDSTSVAGSSDEGSQSESNGAVVFARETALNRSNPVSKILQFPQLRVLGWSGIILGALLLLLIPLMIWEKRSGWLRNHLLKPKDSSKK